MKGLNFLIIIALLIIPVQSGIAQDQDPPPGVDEELTLDEVEVNEEDRRRRRLLPETGTLSFEPLPVRMSSSPPILQHSQLELILRPVRIRPDGTYELDETKGRRFTSVDVELHIDKVIVGSRRPLATHGRRTVNLPEATYAITESKYLVFQRIGRGVDPDTGLTIEFPKQTYSFCMAERAIAFDIKNGETTDLGRLIVRALERGFRRSAREHRPILGADAEFLAVSHPDFRNKTPQTASAGIIEFQNTTPLCRENSIPVPGWFTPEELAETLPRFSGRLDTGDEES